MVTDFDATGDTISASKHSFDLGNYLNLNRNSHAAPFLKSSLEKRNSNKVLPSASNPKRSIRDPVKEPRESTSSGRGNGCYSRTAPG